MEIARSEKEPTTPQATTWRAFPPLEPLEAYSGLVFGPRRTPLPPDRILPTETRSIRKVLEEIVFPAVARPPCFVAFSGGRDSSALLALATHVARSHGFDDPVPITYVFDEHPRSHEGDWQDLVLRHLGLNDREIVRDGADRLDALGEIVRRTLLRHGLFWPPNMHSIIPLLEASRGGSLITGKGGDEMFAAPEEPPSFRWAAARGLPLRRAVNYAISGLLPTPLGLRFKYRNRLALRWLRPSARREVRRLFFVRFRQRPSVEEEIIQFNDSRYLETYLETTEILAGQTETSLVNPFIDPRFFAAWLGPSDPGGFADRSAAMNALFGDLLPPATVRRSTKAVFTDVFWGPQCHEFAASWDGTGLDSSLVDVDALRVEWAKAPPDFRAVAPLQAAWLASQ